MVCSILRASDLVGLGRTWELAFSTSCPGDTVAPGLWTHFGNHWLKLTSVRLMLPLLHTEIHVARKEAWEGLAGGSTLLSCRWEKGPPNSVSFSMEESLLWQRIYNRFFFFFFFFLSFCPFSFLASLQWVWSPPEGKYIFRVFMMNLQDTANKERVQSLLAIIETWFLKSQNSILFPPYFAQKKCLQIWNVL